MWVENEHSTLSSSTRNESALFFDEATSLIKSNLHSLLYNLADIFNVSLVTFFSERNIADVQNQMRSVVSGFDIAGSVQLSKFS